MFVRGIPRKSNPNEYELSVVFQGWNTITSVPSWKVLSDGPSMRLRPYPSRTRNMDWGASVRLKSLIRRTVSILCSEKVIGKAGFDVVGFSGLASRL